MEGSGAQLAMSEGWYILPGGTSFLWHPAPGTQQLLKERAWLLQTALGACVLMSWKHTRPESHTQG